MNDAELARLRPTEGARFLLELDGVEGEAARYRAWIIVPDARFGYGALLVPGGEPALTADDQPAPAELEKMLRMIAKLTARSIKGDTTWPNRVLRWRGKGRGGD